MVKKLDPILRFERYLLENGVLSKKDVEATRESVRKEIEDAVAFAKSCPDPKPEDAVVGVFVE